MIPPKQDHRELFMPTTANSGSAGHSVLFFKQLVPLPFKEKITSVG